MLAVHACVHCVIQLAGHLTRMHVVRGFAGSKVFLEAQCILANEGLVGLA